MDDESGTSVGMSRYDLTDLEWCVIEPLLPNKPRRGLLATLRSRARCPGRRGPAARDTGCSSEGRRSRARDRTGPPRPHPPPPAVGRAAAPSGMSRGGAGATDAPAPPLHRGRGCAPLRCAPRGAVSCGSCHAPDRQRFFPRPAPGASRLDPVRSRLPALFHAYHHLHLRPLLRLRRGADGEHEGEQHADQYARHG